MGQKRFFKLAFQVDLPDHVFAVYFQLRKRGKAMHEQWKMLPLVTMLASCASGDTVMQPHYAKEAVQPIKATLAEPERLTLGYRIPMETLFYSEGVDYKVEDGVLRVYINRCNINTSCKVMTVNQRPPEGSWDTEVTLPYHGERVVVVHSDGEQQVYP